mgnify:FL=1
MIMGYMSDVDNDNDNCSNSGVYSKYDDDNGSGLRDSGSGGEVKDILNEDTLVVGMGDVPDELVSIAKRNNMHYYCQQSIDVYTLYAILGAVEISRKFDTQQAEDVRLEYEEMLEERDRDRNRSSSNGNSINTNGNDNSGGSAPNSGRPVSSSRPISSGTTTTNINSTTATTTSSTKYIDAIKTRKNSFKALFEPAQDTSGVRKPGDLSLTPRTVSGKLK